MTKWNPDMSQAPRDGTQILLWCSDKQTDGAIYGAVMGRVIDFPDDEFEPRGSMMHGDWKFSHWMPLPKAPS